MTPSGDMAKGNLGDLIRSDIDLDRCAVIDLRAGGHRWTYRAIDAAAQQVGVELFGRGSGRGDRIGIIADNSAEYLCAYLGIMRAGMTVVPVNAKLPAATIQHILDDANVGTVMVDQARAALVPSGRKVLRIDQGSIISPTPPTVRTLATMEPSPDEIAEILYTSGSTGRPKGVPLSHHGQRWALSKHVSAKPQLDERTLIAAPLFHMNGLFNISLALMNGVEVILLPRFETRAWLQAIADHRCTTLSGIATMFMMAAREGDLTRSLDLSSVLRVKLGSAPLSEAQVEQVANLFPNAEISNGYGTTEVGPSIFGEHPDGKPRPTLSVGYPIPEIEWRLSDGDDTGVLELKTPALFDGYLNLPAVTAERLKDGWYNTGDIMRRDTDGFFYFVGRADDMFICGGENIYPAEVEEMLTRHPGVAQATVVPAPDLIKGQIPIAFIVPASGAKLSADELKAYSLREGPPYSHPRAFVMLEAMPFTGPHKVDRATLTRQAAELSSTLGRG